MNRFLALFCVYFGAAAAAEVTYSKEVSRLMQAKCQSCHRSGDIAPFPLMTYEETKSRAAAIRSAVSSQKMPPWKPSAGSLEFQNAFGLSEEERKLILEWLANGAPEGDKADLPAAPEETGEWQLGPPDLVLEMPKSFDVPAGTDTYRCFVLPYELARQSWLSAAQVLPGNRSVVHHALLFLDPDGVSEAWDGKDGKPGYDCFGDAGDGVEELVGAWVPGARTTRLPETIGVPLPTKGRIVMQVHYHDHGGHDRQSSQGEHGGHGAAAGHGAPATDRTKAGFYFTKLPPKQEMIYSGLQTDEIEIAPGEPEEVVQVEESFSPVFDLEMLVVGPHMHLVGKSIKVEKLAANSGAAEMVIAIDNWDFDYQGLYTLKKKLPLEAGSGLRLTCSYDNSADNPRNPNSPPVKVVYGEASTDEMCLAFVGIVLPEGFNVGASQRQISQWLMRKTSGSKKGGSR